MRPAAGSTSSAEEQHPMFERHFSVRTLAELWGWSESTIQRWFEDEPGVLAVAGRSRRGPGRVSLRIPESVARRVYERHKRREGDSV